VSRPAVVRRAPIPQGLIDKVGSLARELGKFGTVGAICYVVDISIFNLLRVILGEPIGPKIISTVIATTLAFLGNRFWTWKDRGHSGPSPDGPIRPRARPSLLGLLGLTREYPLFFGVNLVGLGIGVACLSISHHWLGSYWPVLTSNVADNLSANVIGMGLATLFRFWAYRRFVFRSAPIPES
jgi:putative flippase GtrA